jgi:nucleoid-associated protein YgaU
VRCEIDFFGPFIRVGTEHTREDISAMPRKMGVPAAVMTALLWALLSGAGPGEAEAGVAGSTGETVEHQVIKGDNLHLLAGYYYSDPRQWRKIFDRNQGIISDANVILPGTVLKIKADPPRQWKIPYGEFVSRVFD